MFKTTIRWTRKHKPPCKNSTQTCSNMHNCTHKTCESYIEYKVNKLKLDEKMNKHKQGQLALNQVKYDSMSKHSNHVVGMR